MLFFIFAFFIKESQALGYCGEDYDSSEDIDHYEQPNSIQPEESEGGPEWYVWETVPLPKTIYTPSEEFESLEDE